MYALNHFLLALNQNKAVADRTSVSYQTSTSAKYFHRLDNGTKAQQEGILVDLEPGNDCMFLCQISFKKRMSQIRQISSSAEALIKKHMHEAQEADGRNLPFHMTLLRRSIDASQLSQPSFPKLDPYTVEGYRYV